MCAIRNTHGMSVVVVVLQLSKEVIDFNLGEEPCPLNEIVRDQFTITNESGKKIKFRFDPIPSAR